MTVNVREWMHFFLGFILRCTSSFFGYYFLGLVISYAVDFVVWFKWLIDWLIDVSSLFRGQETVKHFPVTVRGDEYDFGFITFSSLKEFVDHFNSQPIIAGKSGKILQ